MEIIKLKLSDIVESPHNPREDFDKEKLAELAADIGARGVLQPITVRKVGKQFQVVMGARRFQASVLAETGTIDAIVREMTDLEAEEAQVVENEKRDDLKPLERARGYAGLMERHGLSVDDIALKLGKARSTVYRVLKLNSLDPRAKKALAEGVIPSSTAELLAQLPPSRQGKATGEVLVGQFGEGPFTYRQALDFLKEHYFLDLRQALFDTKDETLYPEAGACGPCQKRSDCQKDLFGADKKAAPLCLDEDCWYVKEARGATAEAGRRGLELLTGKAVEQVFSRWGDINQGQPYLRLDAHHPQDAKNRTYKELLTTDQLRALTVLAINPKHELVELLKTDGLQEALTEAGKFKKRAAAGTKPGSAAKVPAISPEAKAKHEAELALFRRTQPAVLKGLLAAVEKQASSKALLGLLVQKLWGMAEYIVNRRRLPASASHLDAKEFKKHFGGFSSAQLTGVLFEIAYDNDLSLPEEHQLPEFDAKVVEAAKVLGVDLKKLAKQAQATVESEEQAASTPEQKAEAEAASVVSLKKPKAGKKPTKVKAKKPAKAKPAKKKAA